MIHLLLIVLLLVVVCAVNAFIDKNLIKAGKQPNHTLNAEIYTGIALVVAILYVSIHQHPIWDVFYLLGMAWCLRAVAFNIILSKLRGLPWDYKSPSTTSKVDQALNVFGLTQEIVYLGEAALTLVLFLIVAIQ